MTAFESSVNRKNIAVFMDPSTEIDDEILAYVLMQQETSNTDVFFVCVPGITAKHNPTEDEIEHQVQRRIQRMRDVFPDRFGGICNAWRPRPNDNTSSVFVLCSYYTFQTSVEFGEITIDTLLHVAPLWHIPASTLEVFNFNQRIFMGDLSDPSKSINGTKAMFKGPQGDALREEFIRQEDMFSKICKNTINIPTSFARQVPTPVAFVNALPETMRIPLLNTAFSQFVGRPHPKFPWAEDISRVNYTTILNMLSRDVHDSLFANMDNKAISEAEKFLGDHSSCPDYKNRLAKIAMTVQHITKVAYDGSGFSEDALMDKVLAKQNWSTYITEHNSDLTPFYDGLAWVFMKEIELHRTLPDVERCKKVISEFNPIPSGETLESL